MSEEEAADPVQVIHTYGALTAEALARFLMRDTKVAIEILNGLIAMLEPFSNTDDHAEHEQDAMTEQIINPPPGLSPSGGYWTVQTWFIDQGLTSQTGPDGNPLPSDFMWTPNAPNSDSPDWATAEWVWRPSVVVL